MENIALSHWLFTKVLVRNRWPALLETAMTFGSAVQNTEHRNTENHEKHWPQNAVHYLCVITLLIWMIFKCLIWSFGIVVTSETFINSRKSIPEAPHVLIIGKLTWRTGLHTALQDIHKPTLLRGNNLQVGLECTHWPKINNCLRKSPLVSRGLKRINIILFSAGHYGLSTIPLCYCIVWFHSPVSEWLQSAQFSWRVTVVKCWTSET